MRNFAITCDWLQLYCHNQNPTELELTALFSTNYRFVKEDISSRQFRDIYSVYNCENDLYANIQLTPFSSIIDKNACIIKLSNRELYKSNFANVLINFLEVHNFKYRSISRIDVCYDFNTFCQGMKPRRLINSFLSKRILKNNQGSYHLMGGTRLINDYSYIRFGTRSSAVCSYMYDKTKELREVKDKPYIRQLWKLNGIDDTQEVWRVEISIKSDMTHMVRTDTGEIFRLSPDDLKVQTDIESIFYSYAKKYFSFKINDGTKNKSRMKDVALFSRTNEVTTKPLRLTYCNDSTRSDKIFIKKLEKIKNELRHMDDNTLMAIEQIRTEFCIQKNLSEYYYEKVHGLVEPRK